jgi:hypothetical protein
MKSGGLNGEARDEVAALSGEFDQVALGHGDWSPGVGLNGCGVEPAIAAASAFGRWRRQVQSALGVRGGL